MRGEDVPGSWSGPRTRPRIGQSCHNRGGSWIWRAGGDQRDDGIAGFQATWALWRLHPGRRRIQWDRLRRPVLLPRRPFDRRLPAQGCAMIGGHAARVASGERGDPLLPKERCVRPVNHLERHLSPRSPSRGVAVPPVHPGPCRRRQRSRPVAIAPTGAGPALPMAPVGHRLLWCPKLCPCGPDPGFSPDQRAPRPQARASPPPRLRAGETGPRCRCASGAAEQRPAPCTGAAG